MKHLKLKDNEKIPKHFTGIVEWASGLKEWFKKGKHHRLDGPAIEWVNGDKQWLKEGKTHRVDGPAIELSGGYKEWWIDNKSIKKEIDISNKIFLGKENGKYKIEWLKFLTETGIEEYPLVPGMPPYQFRIFKDISLDELLKVGV